MSTATLQTLGTPPPPGASLTDDLLPCRVADADLWFAEAPADLELAKALCERCPVRLRCLRSALDRGEPWGVWGGEIFEHGSVVARKRPRGRPRKNTQPTEDPALAGSAA